MDAPICTTDFPNATPYLSKKPFSTAIQYAVSPSSRKYLKIYLGFGCQEGAAAKKKTIHARIAVVVSLIIACLRSSLLNAMNAFIPLENSRPPRHELRVCPLRPVRRVVDACEASPGNERANVASDIGPGAGVFVGPEHQRRRGDFFQTRRGNREGRESPLPKEFSNTEPSALIAFPDPNRCDSERPPTHRLPDPGFAISHSKRLRMVSLGGILDRGHRTLAQ